MSAEVIGDVVGGRALGTKGPGFRSQPSCWMALGNLLEPLPASVEGN